MAPAQHSNYLRMELLMYKFNVTGVWREEFPNDISFTWKNHSSSRNSSIDFWLILNRVSKDDVTVNIFTPPTEHRAIGINVKLLKPILLIDLHNRNYL